MIQQCSADNKIEQCSADYHLRFNGDVESLSSEITLLLAMGSCALGAMDGPSMCCLDSVEQGGIEHDRNTWLQCGAWSKRYSARGRARRPTPSPCMLLSSELLFSFGLHLLSAELPKAPVLLFAEPPPKVTQGALGYDAIFPGEMRL